MSHNGTPFPCGRNSAIDQGRELTSCDLNAITLQAMLTHIKRRSIMASITIRKLDDGLKPQLGIRATRLPISHLDCKMAAVARCHGAAIATRTSGISRAAASRSSTHGPHDRLSHFQDNRYRWIRHDSRSGSGGKLGRWAARIRARVTMEAKMLSLLANGPIDYTLRPKKLPSRKQKCGLTAKVKAPAAKLEPGTREP